MKCLVVSLVLSFSFLHLLNAQRPVLYGTSTSGNGGIFSYTEEKNQLRNVYRFRNSGIFSKSHMVVGKDGMIYGVTEGGPLGNGIIYSLDPATNQYTIRKSFRSEIGARGGLNSALVQGKDGKLYGTTWSLLYSFDPVTSEYRELFKFGDSLTTTPTGLTMASDGLLYGMINSYNNSSTGFLFSFDPVEKKFQKKIEANVDGAGAMIEAGNGILYGVKSGGLFSYSIVANQLTVYESFNSTAGSAAKFTLTRGSDGKLYSIARQAEPAGKELIFCFDPKDNSTKVIYVFDGRKADYTMEGLAEGDDGRLYGMTLKTEPASTGGDIKLVGSVFYSVDKNGNNYRVVREFDHIADYPQGQKGNFVLANHKIYGVAIAERTNPYEYIFSYDTQSDVFQKSIRTNQDKGFLPSGNLLQARDGRFYGVTTAGGLNGVGGIFSFNPGSGLYTFLFPFSQDRGYSVREFGYYSKNELVEAFNGKLYGVNSDGGPGKSGVIYSYDPAKSRYVTEKSFRPGSRPITGLVAGKDGYLYGTIELGEDEEFQYQLISFNPVTRKYQELDLLGPGNPASFMQASDGKLYAPANNAIYIFDPETKTVELVHPQFDSDGYSLSAQRLVEAADHKLYGCSSFAGPDGEGLIYSFDPSDRSFAIVFNFDGANGFFPIGTLLSASDSKLYGTTAKGGKNDLGVLFSYDPLHKSFKLLEHFDEFTGGNPGGNGSNSFQSLGSSRLVELNTSIPPIVSITDRKVFEGETAALTVSLNRVSMEPVFLNYRTVAGTAAGDGENPDFIASSGQVTIPPGEISTTISVPLLEDKLVENRETFTVVLQKANEGVFQLGDSVGVVNIKDGTAPVIPPGGEIITLAPATPAARESANKYELVIIATPNPSANFFSLHIDGNRNDRVSVTVTNLSGQVMDKFNGAFKNGEVTFGRNYQSGTYFVKVDVGESSKVLKLVKTP